MDNIISITSTLNSYVQDVEDGFINPLDAFINLKQLEDKLKILKDQIKEQALTEANKYGAKSFEYQSFKIEISGKTTYDYSGIAEWSKLKEKMKAIEEKSKRAVYSNKLGAYIDEATGKRIQPPVATFTDFLKISQIKK